MCYSLFLFPVVCPKDLYNFALQKTTKEVNLNKYSHLVFRSYYLFVNYQFRFQDMTTE